MTMISFKSLVDDNLAIQIIHHRGNYGVLSGIGYRIESSSMGIYKL
jgi:hypothetical protein